jgi:hypothetical protein
MITGVSAFRDAPHPVDLARLLPARRQAGATAELGHGEIRRLIINMPPRHLKSLTVSVAFPAFLLGLEAEASHLRHQLRSELRRSAGRGPSVVCEIS